MLSYALNAGITIVYFIVLIKYLSKIITTLGFVFMGGSLLKFVLFFTFFYPLFKSDGELSKAEFVSFFIPYAIALILEVYFLIKILNRYDEQKPSESH